VADMYEVLAEQPLAILTIKDPHGDLCPHGCTAHKHEQIEVEHGGTFDLADLPAGTNVDVLVQAGLIRKAQPADKAKKD
jgi:hypothetical protein